MIVDLLSLFPEYFSSPLLQSILGRAIDKGLIEVNCINIRDFAHDKHKTVDDRPYGGGPGMVLKPEPVMEAIESVKTSKSHVIYLSPQGKVLTAKRCEELAKMPHLVLLSGHYEGVDERVIELGIDEEISIGDYVLTSGAPAALVVLDAVSRFIPGVIGHPEAAYQDSFHLEEGFDAPKYTRPLVYREKTVPPVLVEGHHLNIARWCQEKAKEKMSRQRPDLIQADEEKR